MKRNDSILYTGSNSLTVKNQELREEIKKDKEELKSKLAPGAEVLLEIIAKEKSDVASIEKFPDSALLDDGTFKAEIQAKKQYTNFLRRLETLIANTMREKEKR